MHRYGSHSINVLCVITSRHVNTVTDHLIKEIPKSLEQNPSRKTTTQEMPTFCVGRTFITMHTTASHVSQFLAR